MTEELRSCVDRGEWASARRALAARDAGLVAQSWSTFKPLEKAALFKLMEEARAFEVFRRLPHEEQYFLLGAFELGTIAPLLEGLEPKTRALFRRFDPKLHDAMFRELVGVKA